MTRDTRQALRRGWSGTCPRCGHGRLFTGYLKLSCRCTACGLDLSPQRTDDGPAYLTILIVGHLVVPLMPLLYRSFDPTPWALALCLSTLALALSLWLLPRIKGAMLGLQWARALHGF